MGCSNGGDVVEDDKAATVAGAEGETSDLEDWGRPGSPRDGAEANTGAKRAEV
jgi:hypothetical protein